MKSLKEIEQLVNPMMDAYRAEYRKITGSKIAIINDICTHLESSRGKQLRPLLALLTYSCCGNGSEQPPTGTFMSVVAALEMLHNSSLIHDDVIDNADMRRGIATTNSLWNNKVAVLMGDYLLALVMKTVNDVDNCTATAIINNTALKMSMGELMQQQCCGKYDTDEAICLQIIEMKTACFMSASCELGALFATDDAEARERARLTGLNLGMAFQIRDDLHDFLPAAVTGKPQGNDLREHKATLPVINALRSINNQAEKQRLVSLMSKQELDDNDIETITSSIRDSIGWHHTLEQLNNYLTEAETHLNHLPNNNYRQGLQDLIDLMKEK